MTPSAVAAERAVKMAWRAALWWAVALAAWMAVSPSQSAWVTVSPRAARTVRAGVRQEALAGPRVRLEDLQVGDAVDRAEGLHAGGHRETRRAVEVARRADLVEVVVVLEPPDALLLQLLLRLVVLLPRVAPSLPAGYRHVCATHGLAGISQHGRSQGGARAELGVCAV